MTLGAGDFHRGPSARRQRCRPRTCREAPRGAAASGGSREMGLHGLLGGRRRPVRTASRIAWCCVISARPAWRRESRGTARGPSAAWHSSITARRRRTRPLGQAAMELLVEGEEPRRLRLRRPALAGQDLAQDAMRRSALPAAGRATAHSTASRMKRASSPLSREIFTTKVPRCGSTRTSPIAELDEGLAHRLAAHPQAVGDILLGEHLAGLDAHRHDRVTQRAGYLPGDRLRREQGRWRAPQSMTPMSSITQGACGSETSILVCTDEEMARSPCPMRNSVRARG